MGAQAEVPLHLQLLQAAQGNIVCWQEPGDCPHILLQVEPTHAQGSELLAWERCCKQGAVQADVVQNKLLQQVQLAPAALHCCS